MGSIILVYAALMTFVVLGLIAASMVYRARRSKEPAGQPHIAPPLTKDQPPPPPRG